MLTWTYINQSSTNSFTDIVYHTNSPVKCGGSARLIMVPKNPKDVSTESPTYIHIYGIVGYIPIYVYNINIYIYAQYIPIIVG